MTFLDKLQSHKGGLVQLKTQLCWYDGRGHDNNPGRICLILDANAVHDRRSALADATTPGAFVHADRLACALLLTDGKPQWVWVAEQEIDILVNDPPTD